MLPTPEEQARRDEVMHRILACVAENQTIKLPDFDASRERSNDRFALINVGIEENPFTGTLGPYRYQFEGEEDLLHLIVTALAEGDDVPPADARRVAAFVFRGVPPALLWFRPGELSGHFYIGHDELPDQLEF